MQTYPNRSGNHRLFSACAWVVSTLFATLLALPFHSAKSVLFAAVSYAVMRLACRNRQAGFLPVWMKTVGFFSAGLLADSIPSFLSEYAMVLIVNVGTVYWLFLIAGLLAGLRYAPPGTYGMPVVWFLVIMVCSLYAGKTAWEASVLALWLGAFGGFLPCISFLQPWMQKWKRAIGK